MNQIAIQQYTLICHLSEKLISAKNIYQNSALNTLLFNKLTTDSLLLHLNKAQKYLTPINQQFPLSPVLK